jgi:YVTN family beta-propeller protein
VGQHPFGLAINASGEMLVAVNVQTNDVSLIDTVLLHEKAKVSVGISPYCAVFSEDGRVFVTNQHSDSVSVIDVASSKMIKTIMVGAFPEGIEIDHGLLFVVSWMEEELDVIDLQTLKIIRRIPAGKNSRGFGQFIWSGIPPSN